MKSIVLSITLLFSTYAFSYELMCGLDDADSSKSHFVWVYEVDEDKKQINLTSVLDVIDQRTIERSFPVQVIDWGDYLVVGLFNDLKDNGQLTTFLFDLKNKILFRNTLNRFWYDRYGDHKSMQGALKNPEGSNLKDTIFTSDVTRCLKK